MQPDAGLLRLTRFGGTIHAVSEGPSCRSCIR